MEASNIDEAVRLLKSGQVVAFPTETVYGLGAIAFDSLAVARIFEIKGRPRFDPLIVHVANAELAFDLCQSEPSLASRLAEAFWPGPLTLVLPKHPSIPDIVTAGLPSVAVRVPSHPVAQQLLAAVAAPLAAPSANRFGRISPTTAAHVYNDLGNDVPMILDGGSCTQGIESTILSLLEKRPQLLRHGSVSLEEIQNVIGEVESNIDPTERPLSPGQLPSHYAPKTRLQFVRDAAPPGDSERVGLLAMGPTLASGYAAIEVLSESGELREAACNLFAALRRLDERQLDRIVCEFAPQQGLGNAINDRLWRGCQR